MAKTSKRSRKFEAKGGAKAMLEKGTITKKGKLKKKRRSGDNVDHSVAMEAKRLKVEKMKAEAEEKRQEEDFVGESNLGDLDVDAFLNSVNDGVESQEESEDEPNDVEMDDDDEDDSDGDAELDDNESSDDEDFNAESMEEGLAKLAEQDPEFHKYLKENEKDLLEFENDDDEEDEDADEEDDADDEEKEVDQGTSKEAAEVDEESNSQNVVVTAELLKTYERGAFKSHGIKALRRILSAYTSACHMADAVDENEDGSGRIRKSGKKSYHIESSKVFDKLMILCLTKCHEEFHYHLLGKGASVGKDDNDSEDEEKEEDNEASDTNKPFNPRHLARSIRWTQLKLPIQSFIKATLHLVSEAKEAKLLTFIVKSLDNYVPYLSAYPRLGKAMLKTLTSLWSSTSDATPEYQTVRLNAFLRIRQLALTQPFPFIEQCLKTTYLSYAKAAKFANAATVTSLLPTLTFMGNCVVELYSLDYASSYQHAFVYIRQLALHLRTALQKKSPETLRVVYCWQYMHCLKLWSAVLAATCGTDGAKDESSLMRSLIYPLVEIIFGVAKLVPASRHLPLRLHCVRFLQQIAACSETFIPTTSLLLEAFDLKEVNSNPRKGKNRGSDVQGVRLPVILKLPKDGALQTPEQLDACLGEIFLLLNREVDLYKYSAGCPEFTIRICQRLRKFAKETRNGKFRAYAKGCIELCEKHAKAATTARSKLEEAPKDIKKLEVLKPINAPSMRERYESAISKENRLEAATQPVLSKAAQAKAKKEKETQEKEQKLAEKEVQKRTKKKKKATLNEEDLKNVTALEEDDKVEEGIDWSDSEQSE